MILNIIDKDCILATIKLSSKSTVLLAKGLLTFSLCSGGQVNIFLPGFPFSQFGRLLNSKNEGGLQVRGDEGWNYSKSGDISDVSQVYDDDQSDA